MHFGICDLVNRLISGHINCGGLLVCHSLIMYPAAKIEPNWWILENWSKICSYLDRKCLSKLQNSWFWVTKMGHITELSGHLSTSLDPIHSCYGIFDWVHRCTTRPENALGVGFGQLFHKMVVLLESRHILPQNLSRTKNLLGQNPCFHRLEFVGFCRSE